MRSTATASAGREHPCVVLLQLALALPDATERARALDTAARALAAYRPLPVPASPSWTTAAADPAAVHAWVARAKADAEAAVTAQAQPAADGAALGGTAATLLAPRYAGLLRRVVGELLLQSPTAVVRASAQQFVYSCLRQANAALVAATEEALWDAVLAPPASNCGISAAVALLAYATALPRPSAAATDRRAARALAVAAAFRQVQNDLERHPNAGVYERLAYTVDLKGCVSGTHR